VNKSVVRLQKAPQNQQIPQFSPLTQEDTWVLSLIKTIIEIPGTVDNILDYLDPSQLHLHAQEFSLAISGQNEHPLLVKIMLNENIKAFKEDDLKNELLTFLGNFYNKELKKVNMRKDMSFEKKAFYIRSYREKVNKLKRGELVPFNV
jgi:DNA primase